VETLSVMVIKATNAPVLGRVSESLGRLANLSFSTIQIGIINSILLNLLAASAGALLGLGSILVINKELSIGQVLNLTACRLMWA